LSTTKKIYKIVPSSIVDRFSETCFEDSILELFGKEGRLVKILEKLFFLRHRGHIHNPSFYL
jgi:hypothetical protein